MTRSSDVGKIKKSRVNELVAGRNISVEGLARIERVSPVQETRNDINYRFENFLLSAESFYDSIKWMEEEHNEYDRKGRNITGEAEENSIEGMVIDDKV